MRGWFENRKTLLVWLLWLFLAVTQGLQLHNLTNSIEIDCLNKGSQQGNERATLILTAHWWALFELCQGLNNGDRPLALAENVRFEHYFGNEVCLFVCFCFCRKLHFNHLDWLLILIRSGVLWKLVKHQKGIFVTNIF